MSDKTRARTGRSLRVRLAATLLLTVVPLGIATGISTRALIQWQAIEATADALQDRMQDGGLEQCEAHAGRHGRGRGRRGLGRLNSYNATFEPTDPRSRTLPPEVVAVLSAGADRASFELPNGHHLVAVRAADSGPCAIVAVRRPTPSPPLWLTVVPALTLTLAVMMIALLAAGPLVRRVVRLTAAVDERGDAPLPEIDADDELGGLARAFLASRERQQQALEEVQKRDEALAGFVANTTHDVMIPLTVLQGHISTLLQERPDDARLKASLEESHHLASLLRNLAAAAQLDSRDVPLRQDPLDLAELVPRVVARHRPVARERKVELEFAIPDGPVPITGDVTLLERAIGNLVHNAVRYGEAGGHVALILELEEDRLRLRVLDDGPGVPEAERARLTQRRFRGERARTRQPAGSGLGLAIAREVAERHGWTMRFEHPAEGGLEVVLEGPLASKTLSG